MTETKGSRYWTMAEVNILREEYPLNNSLNLVKKLNKSHTAINQKARLLGIKKKIFIQGDNYGKKNCQWVGDEIKYEGLHGWIRRHKPKPELCEECGKSPPRDLANISGKYNRDVNDFEWICRKCHMAKDGRLINLIRNQHISVRESKDGKLKCSRCKEFKFPDEFYKSYTENKYISKCKKCYSEYQKEKNLRNKKGQNK